MPTSPAFALSLRTARRPWRAGACLLSLVCALSACGDDDDEGNKGAPPGPAPNAACAPEKIETDLMSAPFAGPGVDPATKALALTPGTTYVVSSTYGVPKPGEGGASVSDRYQQLFGAVQTELEAQPGLVAYQLASSPGCGSGRTLAVWKSEADMYAFVTAPAHLAAMNAVGEVLQPNYAVTHWSASSPEAITFAEGVRQIAAK